MYDLLSIKRHVDSHGFGCAIVNDHVAISLVWRTHTLDGKERRLETTERARTLEEACRVIGCDCLAAARERAA
ncbi:hypothetical protein [Amphiplicatus metriothermophilus]|uniref:Uncharacterized protein n=1 Tax=Amphiplicatus metriothermophilus TaxID=1519374 RepID=A0A239PJR1_9PROT|nr:hypothetical protein [Amphiplicatus metriothermophilus]MBB5518107.1 hypothetical protein [Amphiplicatus metriothermophilus]SNT67559.1 hypothetical protein SAMN06297382_0049 [Amphiplicatus metriothermophilus]